MYVFTLLQKFSFSVVHNKGWIQKCFMRELRAPDVFELRRATRFELLDSTIFKLLSIFSLVVWKSGRDHWPSMQKVHFKFPRRPWLEKRCLPKLSVERGVDRKSYSSGLLDGVGDRLRIPRALGFFWGGLGRGAHWNCDRRSQHLYDHFMWAAFQSIAAWLQGFLQYCGFFLHRKRHVQAGGELISSYSL